ncbi:STAS domain-containing protein [Streptomyces sp. bgisy126]|uniref:STAS domain-containing protein n=1 Tax=unclassified Streptomyces TaxID=2593676 RepID=UPI003EBD2406
MDGEAGPSDHDLLITHTAHPGAYVLTLSGAADNCATGTLEADFVYAAAFGPRLVVDLSALTFGNGTLLSLLVHARVSHDVELVGPLAPGFQRRLDTTGTTGWFTVHPTLAAALDH